MSGGRRGHAMGGQRGETPWVTPDPPGATPGPQHMGTPPTKVPTSRLLHPCAPGGPTGDPRAPHLGNAFFISGMWIFQVPISPSVWAPWVTPGAQHVDDVFFHISNVEKYIIFIA